MKVYNRETSFRACDGGGAMRGESGGGGGQEGFPEGSVCAKN